MGLAQCCQLGHACRRTTERGDGLQVSEKERASRQRHTAIVERNLRLLGSHQSCFRAFGDVEEGIDVVLLDGMASLSHILVMCHHLGGLEGIELVNQLSGGRRVVLVNDTHRHVGRHSASHQGGEENHHHDREEYHAEPVDGILPHDAAFSEGYMI